MDKISEARRCTQHRQTVTVQRRYTGSASLQALVTAYLREHSGEPAAGEEVSHAEDDGLSSRAVSAAVQR